MSIDYGASVSEGNSGTKPLNFTVRLSAVSDVPITVNYSTAEGDTEWQEWGYYGYYAPPPAATSGEDFQANTGTLTFAPGETEKTIPVLVNGDHVPEPDEVLSLNLSGASGAGITYGHAVGTIYDDEPYAGIGQVWTEFKPDSEFGLDKEKVDQTRVFIGARLSALIGLTPEYERIGGRDVFNLRFGFAF